MYSFIFRAEKATFLVHFRAMLLEVAGGLIRDRELGLQ